MWLLLKGDPRTTGDLQVAPTVACRMGRYFQGGMGRLSEVLTFDDPTEGMPDYYTYWNDHCLQCFGPIIQPERGRRKFCSNACKQQYYRRMNQGAKDRARWDNEDQRGEKALRVIERRFGPVDDTPDPETGLSPRWRLLFRLRRGMFVPQCHWCGKPFIGGEGLGSDSGCCSKRCRDTLHGFQAKLEVALRQFGDAVDGRLSVRLRLNDPERGVPVLPLREVVGLCIHCGRPFPRYGTRRQTCTEQCRKDHWRRTHRRCKACNGWYKIDATKGEKHLYCSPKCWERDHTIHQPTPAPRICLSCGKSYIPDKRVAWQQGCCSKLCGQRYRKAIPEDRRVRACAQCGEPFVLSMNHLTRQRFCSRQCLYRWHNRRKTERRREKIVTQNGGMTVSAREALIGTGL